MPYNTRRKSLSLPSLGIHLPNSSRRSPSAKLPHATDDHQHPPPKKVKRSHDSLSPERSLSPTSTDARDHLAAVRRRGTLEHTPPPSPMDCVAPKIDTEGINDDIVVGVIEQLESTGNRPHLVKELAAVLVTLNENVANSANPAALLSSRLGTYMKRTWTALSPCPIAKELIPVHPRKVYYYLTTLPRQALPETSDDVVIPSVDGKHITPSVSSVDQDEEDDYVRQRSPSPEVDLSSPDFEDEHAGPGGSARSGHEFDNSRLMHSHRAASPPLEGDEKEFTQTASAVRERASESKSAQSGAGLSAISEGLSAMEDGSMVVSETPSDDSPLSSSISDDRTSEDPYGDYFSHIGSNQEHEGDAAALFGTSPSPSLTSVASSLSSGTSAPSDSGMDSEEPVDIMGAPQISLPEDPDAVPVTSLKRSIDMLNSGMPDVDMKMSDMVDHEDKLSLGTRTVTADAEMVFDFDPWREMQNPETVEVDELDEMFGEI